MTQVPEPLPPAAASRAASTPAASNPAATIPAAPTPAAPTPAGSTSDGSAPVVPPDDKDWTWVLQQPCPECGLDSSRIAVAEVGGLVRAATPRWVAALARSDARRRPSPTVWSVTEYGAHVRDVHRVFAARLSQMLTEDTPTFANWDQDAAALEGRYASLEPGAVAVELGEAAETAASAFDAVTDSELARGGVRSNGSLFTVTTLAQYYWHDIHHHLHDVVA